MQNQAKRSNYGKASGGYQKQKTATSVSNESTKPTHSIYYRVGEGEEATNEYVDNLLVYENEGKFGSPYFSLVVLEDVTLKKGRITISKKKSAQ